MKNFLSNRLACIIFILQNSDKIFFYEVYVYYVFECHFWIHLGQGFKLWWSTLYEYLQYTVTIIVDIIDAFALKSLSSLHANNEGTWSACASK